MDRAGAVLLRPIGGWSGTTATSGCCGCAQIVSELGDWLYSIAIYSLLLELTGSATSVATRGGASGASPVLRGAGGGGGERPHEPQAGDDPGRPGARGHRAPDAVRCKPAEWVGLIYVLLFVETMMWAFFEPARSSVIPNITRGKELLVANTLSSTTWSVNLAIGSAIGGVVAVLFGRNTVFVINALSFLLSASLLRGMRFAEPHAAGAPPLRASDLADFSPVLEGLRYVTRNRRLLATLLVKAGLGFMGTNWVILPVLGERNFPVLTSGLDPAASQHAGNESADGRSRRRGAAGAADRQLLGGAEASRASGPASCTASWPARPGTWRSASLPSSGWLLRRSCWPTRAAPPSGSSRPRCCRGRPKTVSVAGSSRPTTPSWWSRCRW